MTPQDAGEGGITPGRPVPRDDDRRLRVAERESSLVAWTADRPSDNLPIALSTFVGREREVAELKRLVEDTRLLTLTGPGGSGKTRLAMAVAVEVVGRFEDGAWWVELAPLSDPELVPQAIATALDVEEAPERALNEAIVEDLKSREVLLILDNCEHLMDACAALADALLRTCPGLKILATSREALNIGGEREWIVPPLSLPDPGWGADIKKLGHYEAARLFLERAKGAVPSFELTVENAPAVARLCRRLDGIPLAIELAAARTKVLSAEQILGRLEDSLKLLTGTDRTAPERQRTLRGTLDWSYDLLGEQERKLFGRLSVFAGGWTLEAAEFVGSGEDIEGEEILDLLSGLVDKSMVVAEVGIADAPRYRLLEPVRQYGLERLEESEGADRARRRHAEFYLALTEETEPELKGPRQVELLDRLEEDHDNLRAAIRWALEQGGAEMALRLTASAAHFRYPRGYLTEGRRQLEAALAGASGPPAARAKALTEVGWFALEQSDYDQAQSSLEESLQMYRELDDKYGVAHALECLSVAKWRLGDYGRAAQLQEESLALYRELGHEWGIAASLNNLGVVAQEQGDYERAAALHLESLALSRLLGDSLEIGWGLRSLAQVYLRQGQFERSATLLEESQSILRELGTKLTLAQTLRTLGETVLRQGDGTRAAAVYGEGLALAAEAGSKTEVAGCLEGLAEVALTHGRSARAARLWGAADALREAIGAHPSPSDRSNPGYGSALAAASSRPDGAAWETGWSEGRQMTQEEAIGYALLEEEVEPAPQPKVSAGLSERELEVLRLVAEGLTDPQVASRLYISPRTVGFHLRSVYRKLGVSSRAAAASEATRRFLI
jgi:predicted ATPase/DNA-binding CsgD family transcriptional regulator